MRKTPIQRNMLKLSKPLEFCQLTQPFGVNYVNFYTKLGLKGHNGLDFVARNNKNVYATHKGRVKIAGGDTTYGIEVRLVGHDEELGFYETIYCHLKEVKVKVGEEISAGTLIGISDNTGQYTTGDHLHFGLRPLDDKEFPRDTGNGYYGWINPEPYFEKDYKLIPVQKRYGRFYDPERPGNRPWHAYLNEVKVAGWLWKELKRKPTNEEITACVYGGWDLEAVRNPAMYSIWSMLKKSEYQRGKKPYIF